MIHQGDCLSILREQFADESVQCCVTSPPYWGLRDYGVAGQLGLEPTPAEYVEKMVAVFREVRRVLRDDGTLWLNLGDNYINHPANAVNRNGMSGTLNNGVADFPCRDGTRGDQKRVGIPNGLKVKDLAGIPWRVAFALQADGWYLRQDIIWAKPNPMPESVTDRCTKAHEYLFMFAKSERYFYDADAIAEPLESPAHAPGNKKVDASRNDADQMQKVWGLSGTRNKRTVWTVATSPYAEAHFATFPPKLIEPCILAGCPSGGLVLDPFAGSGTTIQVAQQLGRQGVGIELNPAYITLSDTRTAQTGLAL